MSQSVYIGAVPDDTAILVRQRFNAVDAALASKNCGTSFPSSPQPCMEFWHLSTGEIWVRSTANDAWLLAGYWNTPGGPTPTAGGKVLRSLSTALCNYVAVGGDPTSALDRTQGYAVGSELLNIASSPPRLWKCVSDAVGAAVWRLISPIVDRVEISGTSVGSIEIAITAGKSVVEIGWDCSSPASPCTIRFIIGTASTYITSGYASKLLRPASTIFTYSNCIPVFKQDDRISRSCWGTVTLVRNRGNIWTASAQSQSTSGVAHLGSTIVDLGAGLNGFQLSADAGTFPSVGFGAQFS